MIPLIEDNREAIVALCTTYGVRKLALFGSAARGDFDPAKSDVDVVLEFADYGPGVGRRFISLRWRLEDLLLAGGSIFVFEIDIQAIQDFLHEVAALPRRSSMTLQPSTEAIA